MAAGDLDPRGIQQTAMALRVVSLVPSATEIVGALSAPGEFLVGATHECDRPEWVRSLPKVVQPRLPGLLSAAPSEIDRAVSASMKDHQPLYAIDAELLIHLRPDLIVTQSLCNVCTISAEDVASSISSMVPKPDVLELSPNNLDGVLESILRVGEAIDRADAARKLVDECASRMSAIQMQTTGYPLPRVLVLEWTDPLWVAGHWIAEMVEIGGGVPLLTASGEPSRRIEPIDVQAAEADVLIIACCGYDLARNRELALNLIEQPMMKGVPAVRHDRVYAVDASAQFSRPSQGLIDGIESIAEMLRGSEAPSAAWEKVSLRRRRI